MPSDVAVASVWAFVAAFAYRFNLLPTTVDEALLAGSRPVEQQALLGFLASAGTYLVVKHVLRFVFGLFYETNPLATTGQLLSTFSSQEKRRNIKVENRIDEYNELHKIDLGQREKAYQKLVDAYYGLSHRRPSISLFHTSTTSAQSLPPSSTSGVGASPSTSLCCQAPRGARCACCAQLGLSELCEPVEGNFLSMPFEDSSFDGAYAIEATCHAPSREGVFSQILRVLKPGSHFVCYEWCLTDKYDPTNEYHRKIKKMIEEGDGLPDTATCTDVAKAAK